MDPRVDPMDTESHAEAVDLIRRSEFADALETFGRLIRLAYTQGMTDGYVNVIRRVANTTVEDDVRKIVGQP